jgi:hypothetical protein
MSALGVAPATRLSTSCHFLLVVTLLGGTQGFGSRTQQRLPVGGGDIEVREDLHRIDLCALLLEQPGPFVVARQALLEVCGGPHVENGLAIQMAFNPVDPPNAR